MRINSKKIRKILRKIMTTPKRILKPFALKNHWMHWHECNTHIEPIYFFIQKIKQGFFLYYISCKEK
jgi:hypothetical protein